MLLIVTITYRLRTWFRFVCMFQQASCAGWCFFFSTHNDDVAWAFFSAIGTWFECLLSPRQYNIRIPSRYYSPNESDAFSIHFLQYERTVSFFFLIIRPMLAYQQIRAMPAEMRATDDPYSLSVKKPSQYLSPHTVHEH